ncbi:MAG: autotransporter serine protease fusolisin, partial [Fusobacterium sp.]|nr:autotransporter serine protease fusolisin [Fusobacterium sp.]
RSEHGEQVLSTVMEENVNFKPIVASIGKIGTDGGIELPSKELYQQVLARFGEQKIKVFNQSFGIVNEMNEYKSDMSLKDYRAALGKSIYSNQAIKEGEDLVNFYEQQVKDNTIFVWANGNTKKNSYGYEILPINAFLNAGLPKFRPDLEKGWISAIGIDGKNNYGSKNIHYLQHLAYPGEAAYWSISANGTIKYREGNYIYTAIGSSYAAPRVSRAATLVAEKYPWMSNDQIRQTLFTTTDETEVSNNSEVKRSTRYEPDTKYGWGMLNTERALLGPGAFINILSQYKNSPGANNVFTANISEEYTSYFENNIYGDGGLEKLGKGILHLTGNNTYQKGSKITEGQLHIHQVHAGSIEVKPKGTLVLHERAIVGYNSNSAFLTRNEITATDVSNDRKVHNEGKTKIIGSTAIIGGDYIASSGSITELDLSSKIKVVGNIKIDGDVKITSTEYSTASEKKVLMEGKESFGNISDISIDGMREVKGTLENGVLTAEITRKNTAEYLGNVGESSKNVAENIENIFNDLDNKIKSGTITAAELEMGANIQKMEAETLSLATERISGEIYASSQALNFSQSQNINRDLSNRINGINNLKLKNGEIQTWVSGIGSNGKLKKDGYATADTSIVGGQFGIDKKLNGTTNFGIAMAYSYGKADFNRYAGKAKSDMVGVSLYGNKDLQNKLYLAGRLGISHISTKVERELMTANSDIIKGKIKYDSTMTSVYLEMGKKFEKIIPFIGYSADYLRRGNFSESSAAWGIHSSSQNYWNQNILFGLKSKLDFKNFSLNGHITHEINLGERDLNYEGHFSGNSVKQKFYGIKQPKNKTWIGVGMFKEITQNFGIYGNIDFRFEEGKKADSIYSAGLQYKF